MKIEQLIVQYLYSNKRVTLHGIGTFILDPAVSLPSENEKDKENVLPENAIQFEYNLKATEDDGLVKFIVQHTNKILPLASADLDSYVMLAKQFLNIGKPLVINGVGTVQKNQQGNYQFIPGLFITPKIDDYPKQKREERDESVSFESEGKVNNSRRNLLILIAALVIILAGLGIYYMLNQNTPTASEPLAQKAPISDSTIVDTQVKNTIDTTVIIDSVRTMDSSSFIIVLKNYSTLKAAENDFRKFKASGHILSVLKVDSFQYQLAMPFNAPVSDTLRARDSLREIFGGRPYIKF